jgi:hypothetical protein
VPESLTDTTNLDTSGAITDWAEEEPVPQIAPAPQSEPAPVQDHPERIQDRSIKIELPTGAQLPADCLPDLPSKKKKKASTPRA